MRILIQFKTEEFFHSLEDTINYRKFFCINGVLPLVEINYHGNILAYEFETESDFVEYFKNKPEVLDVIILKDVNKEFENALNTRFSEVVKHIPEYILKTLILSLNYKTKDLILTNLR